MNYFWISLAELYRDRNPVPTFFVALFTFFVVLALGAAAYGIIHAFGWEDYSVYFLAGAAAIFCAWLIRGIRRLRARMRDGYNSTPLSRDEIIKAQCKLIAKARFNESLNVTGNHRVGRRSSRAR
jgi:hypothetical protein